jgi:hypothetical protein
MAEFFWIKIFKYLFFQCLNFKYKNKKLINFLLILNYLI